MYIDSGCNLITTNTFGSNSLKLEPYGYTVDEIVHAAVNNVKCAIKDSGRDDAYVLLDIGPSGKLLKPMGDLAFEDAVSLFAETIKAGNEAGADGVIIETMSDTYEMKAAVIAAKENCSLPIFCTMVFDRKGKLLTGADVRTAVCMLDSLGVDALGVNCGMGPEGMKPIVQEIRKYTTLPLIVNPNAGIPKSKDGKTYFDVTPEEFSENMVEISRYASIVGGCCGTTPEHIKACVTKCRDILPSKPSKINKTYVTSYARTVEIGESPIIIGERINPTGKKLLKEALRNNDVDYILREAISQEQNGAHILDVNVGLPEIDEAKVLENSVYEIQKITCLPLQIDTSDIRSMEKAMRIYNGKPLVNSVNGKKESMESVFPLVKKYGGAVVALTLDESGIPKTAEERYKIAEKIIKTAKEYGIKTSDIIVDPLTLPVSAEEDAGKITLDALEMISKGLGVNTVLGVSNISFGLPDRSIINSTFYTMAMERGLSAGIINPNSQPMMQAYDAFCAVKGYDKSCASYINNRNNAPEELKSANTRQDDMTLYDAVIKGLSDKASVISKELAKTRDVLEIINTELVSALDTVGVGFEKGTVFLPQLLMSAEAAKSAFDSLKQFLNITETAKNANKIILATVKGDIHDIGKNILKVLLQNYQFDVIDLGKDVAPETIVQCAIDNNISLVGLSALMTTTVPSMEETIKQLRNKCPEVKVMVGGAVMTKEYADMIDADFYGKDAMESVRYAQAFYNK